MRLIECASKRTEKIKLCLGKDDSCINDGAAFSFFIDPKIEIIAILLAHSRNLIYNTC